MSDTSLPRLLHGSRGTPLRLDEHDAIFGRTNTPANLIETLEASGLTGRGGAAFPTSAKVRLLSRQRGHGKAVVVNAMEGEPASRKDASLLSANPHLVLDGAVALASMIGAHEIIVCIPATNRRSLQYVRHAVEERSRSRRGGPPIEIVSPPPRYITGEESALTHWLSERVAEPLYRPQRPFVPRIRNRPVLVDNVETCAHVGLIARHGASWFRAVGTSESPGSTLVTLSGAFEGPVVLEAALGTPLCDLIATARPTEEIQAILLGGYGGTWLDASHLDTPLANESLRVVGASVGAGVIVALGEGGCGLQETTRVVTWMAGESARQCGPCAFGLPALAQDLATLVSGQREAATALDRLLERCEVIDGRGACRHPDGVVRLVRSALSTFREHAFAHAAGQVCSASHLDRRYARIPGALAVGALS
jgi:NADH:ubiquinone oxidoreductase subunit F (NADH-binding)